MTDEAIEALWVNRPVAPAPTREPKQRSWATWVWRLLRAWGLSR